MTKTLVVAVMLGASLSLTAPIANALAANPLDPLREFSKLYDELLAIRQSPAFCTYGFARGAGEAWLKRAKALLERAPGIDTKAGERVVVTGELIDLGFEYMHSCGNETDDANELRDRFDAALGR